MLILCLFKFMNMNNLQSGLLFSLTGITAVASLSSCASQKKTEEQKPYNIVYIMTDDHTAQMMSCYDKRYMETPNLDRIANDGVRFTNSFVANSLSGPSRACMITGKHSCANKFYDNTTCIFDGSQQTFPTGIFYCFSYLFFFHNCSYRLFYPEHNNTACRHGKGDPAICDLILRKYFFVYLIGILKGVVSMHIIG